MTTYRQGATARPFNRFGFKVNGKGRTIIFDPTDALWVTNPTHDQDRRGIIMIGRANRHHIGQGYPFSIEQAARLFQFEP